MSCAIITLRRWPAFWVGALAFLVYLATLSPGVYGFDSAELSTGAYTLGIVHPPGYPLYLLLAHLFAQIPIGDVAYRVNLMSAVLGAVTVALTFRLSQRLTGRAEAAWAAAALLAVGYYFWEISVVAEVYTLHTAFLALNLLVLLAWQRSGRERFLYLFALLYGLSLSNHTSGILFAPGYALLINPKLAWWFSHWKTLLGMAMSFFGGLLPYLYLPLRAAAHPDLNYVGMYYNVDLTTPGGTLWMMSGQAYRFFAFGYTWSQLPAEASAFFGFWWREFFGIGVGLGLCGVVSLSRTQRRWCAALLLIFGTVAFFFINYRVVDKDTMFLPAYVVWALFVCEGISALQKVATRLVAGNHAQAVVNPALRAMLLGLAPLGLLLNWQWTSMANNTGPSIFAEQVLRTAKPNAMILATWSPAVVLEYYQIVEGERPDLVIYNRSRSSVATFYAHWSRGEKSPDILRTISEQERDLLKKEVRERPVYSVEYDALFADDYVYQPMGNYYKLSPREGSTAR